MGQTWYSLVFAHWAVGPEALGSLTPTLWRLDLRDGQAWLGVTPFVVRGLRVPRHPAATVALALPELPAHLRRLQGHHGICFFSLDAARLLGVAAATRRAGYPTSMREMSARHQDGTVHYESKRIDSSGPSAELRARYGPAGPASCR
jgi:uncharacterized protein YqjF (DUF2071 family)